MKIKTKVHFKTGKASKKELRAGEAKISPVGRLPRITRLMALAIKFEQMVRDGVVADYAELARLGHVSRARMTQIMNLLNLAPEIQEAILFHQLMEHGKQSLTERDFRKVAAEPAWKNQRQMLLSCARHSELVPDDR